MSNYAIENLDDYANELRQLAANTINPENQENLDDFITICEIKNLVKENARGTDENGKLLIDEEIYEKLFYSIGDWIYGIGLSRLASKNLIECAWDDKLNCMVFWAKENLENSNEYNK
jgi:hypothetical protein